MWSKACLDAELAEGSSMIVEISGKKIALFKRGGKVYAIQNSCLHRGGPLGDGYLEGKVVTCPWHAWTFDVTTGVCETDPDLKQDCYKVKREGRDILVDAG